MAVNLNHVPGTPHATIAQKTFDQARVDHDLAMDNSASYEAEQYNQVLRSLHLYAMMKAACDSDQKTDLGILVGTKATEQWATSIQKTAAILTGLADAQGKTIAQLCEEIQAASLPNEFQSARVAIATA